VSPALPDGWRHVRCALCGADGDEVQVGDRDTDNTPLRMVACRRCGLVYENPAMTEEGLARYYEQEYWKTVGFSDRPTPKGLVGGLYNSRRMAAPCARHLAPGSAVLDIGSATGGLMRAFIELGHQATGVEPSDVWAKFTREVLGLKVIHATMEQAALPDESFALVTMSHVLEHLADPVAGLLAARRVLKPGGLLCVEVPDVCFPMARRPKCFHLAHLTMFSRPTLCAMLDKCGLDLVERLDGEGYLRALARQTAGEAPRECALPAGEAERVQQALSRMSPLYCYTDPAYWRRRLWKIRRNARNRREAPKWRELYGLAPGDVHEGM